jgi:hypothetical protein
MPGPTKVTAEIDAWAAVALAAAREGAAYDVSALYEAGLFIDVCIAGTTAHLGTEVIVELSRDATGDDVWSEYARFITPALTAFKADVASTEAVGQTVLSVTDPTTNKFDHVKKYIFIVDATPANSEICYLVSCEGDATDTITVLDGTTYEHLNTADVYTVDGENLSAVFRRVMELPDWAQRVRVLYNNNFGATGSTVYTRTGINGVSVM